MVGAGDGQAQRRHIVDRLMIEPVKFLVAGPQLQDGLTPVAMSLGLRRLIGVYRALVRCTIMRIAVGELVKQAAVPCTAGWQPDLKAQAAIRENRLGIAASDRYGNRTGEIRVTIGCLQGLPNL